MVFEKLFSLRFVSNGTQEFSSSNIEVSIRLKNHKKYTGGGLWMYKTIQIKIMSLEELVFSSVLF